MVRTCSSQTPLIWVDKRKRLIEHRDLLKVAHAAERVRFFDKRAMRYWMTSLIPRPSQSVSQNSICRVADVRYVLSVLCRAVSQHFTVFANIVYKCLPGNPKAKVRKSALDIRNTYMHIYVTLFFFGINHVTVIDDWNVINKLFSEYKTCP